MRPSSRHAACEDRRDGRPRTDRFAALHGQPRGVPMVAPCRSEAARTNIAACASTLSGTHRAHAARSRSWPVRGQGGRRPQRKSSATPVAQIRRTSRCTMKGSSLPPLVRGGHPAQSTGTRSLIYHDDGEQAGKGRGKRTCHCPASSIRPPL